jgi:hypothetical protein
MRETTLPEEGKVPEMTRSVPATAVAEPDPIDTVATDRVDDVEEGLQSVWLQPSLPRTV